MFGRLEDLEDHYSPEGIMPTYLAVEIHPNLYSFHFINATTFFQVECFVDFLTIFTGNNDIYYNRIWFCIVFRNKNTCDYFFMLDNASFFTQ
jgi:hypothetical protein